MNILHTTRIAETTVRSLVLTTAARRVGAFAVIQQLQQQRQVACG